MNKMTGGIKFFNQNYALFKFGGRASATSNDSGAKSMLDISRYTQWESIGSNDLTLETITIDLNEAKTIDSLFLVDFNFKAFTILYDDGAGGFIPFTGVEGVNGIASSGIVETDYSFGTAFYQFDAVTTGTIKIFVNETQIANEQKYVTQFIATNSIGTFQGFPRVKPDSSRNERKAYALSGRANVQKSFETTRFSLKFKTHPYENDIAIMDEVFDREEPFLIYPCGGRTGTDYFKMEQRNWRLQDIYNVQLIGRLKNEWEKGVYLLGANKTIKFEEHI